MAKRPWQDRESLTELYCDKSLSGYDIADKFGCTPQTVYRWLDRHEIDKRPNHPEPAEELTDESWLYEMYVVNGYSTVDIAKMLDVTNRTVGNWLNRHGIEARPKNVPKNPLITDEGLMREWYTEKGMTLREIANELGVGKSTVKRWFDHHEIEREAYIPPTGEANPQP